MSSEEIVTVASDQKKYCIHNSVLRLLTVVVKVRRQVATAQTDTQTALEYMCCANLVIYAAGIVDVG